MVGGGGKKKGKSGQQNQQQQQHVSKAANNNTAAAAVLNKENQQLPAAATDPLPAADTTQSTQIRIEDSATTGLASDDVTLNSPTNSVIMETPTVSAAIDTPPSSLTWGNKTIDDIPDFVPGGGSLSTGTGSTQSSSLPSNAAAGLPFPSNQSAPLLGNPVGVLSSNHPAQGKGGWNVAAPSFKPTGPVGVPQQPPQVPQYVSTYGPQSLPLAMSGMYPISGPTVNYSAPPTLYKMGPQNFYMQHGQHPAAAVYQSQPPGAKHMSRPGVPPAGTGFDPGYGLLDVHGMPATLKHEPAETTVNINLNSTAGKKFSPASGNLNYANNYGGQGGYHLGDMGPYPTAHLMNNTVPMSVILNREPVNVSAAGLSDGKTFPEPTPPKSVEHPKSFPGPTPPKSVEHPKNVEHPKIVEQPKSFPDPTSKSVEHPNIVEQPKSFPEPTPKSVEQPKSFDHSKSVEHPPVSSKEKYGLTVEQKGGTVPVEQKTVKPVAVLKIDSVMKVEEDGADDSSTPLEPPTVEKPSFSPPTVDKASSSPPTVEKAAAAPSPPTVDKDSSPSSDEKSNVSQPSPPPVVVEQKKKKEASPPVQKTPREEKKSTLAPPLATKTEPKVELPTKTAEHQRAEAKPPVKIETTKPTKADKGDGGQTLVKVGESKNNVDKVQESLPVVSNREASSKELAGKGKKPAKLVEKDSVKPAAPRQATPAGLFNFNSLTSLGEVVINDADRYRSSLKQRSLAKPSPANDDENSDPNRRKYSRSQLMDLKDKPESVKLPEGFNKSIDIFSVGGGSRSGSSNFANYTSFTSSGGGGGGNYEFRGSKSTYKEKDYAQPQMMIHSVSLKEEVKLKTTENAWKPSALKKDPVERVVMDAKSLLNKLSPENFSSILAKFAQLQFSSDNIGKIIDLIIFKAVWEPKFAEVYAKFIEGLKKHFTNSKGVKPEFDLLAMLVVKCANEFEGIVESDSASKLKLESLKKITDEKEREEKRLTYEEEERLSRKKSVGVMTFIGELFKLRLLHPKILHSCFHQLLGTANDVENLECLAKLITSTGKSVEELNSGTNEHAMSSKISWAMVMSSVEKMVSDKNKDKIPSRIRFMILDVLDLRSRNWVPRMVENKPKTMAQIDKDIENEAMRKNMQIRDDDRNMPMNKMPNKKTMQGGGNNSMQQASSQKINVDLEKFKILKNPQSDLELSLRPNLPSFNMFGGASGFKSNSKPSNPARRSFTTAPMPATPLTQNSFSVLSPPELPSGPPSITSQKPAPVSNAARTPLKSKQTTPPPPSAETKPSPALLKDDNLAFEKTLTDGKMDDEIIQEKYREFLTFGANFTDKQDFTTKNNQYREEVNILIARCSNHLNEPLLSFHRLEKLFVGLLDSIEREVTSFSQEQFDPKGLARSLLLHLLIKRPTEQVFLSALLISLLEKHKKMSSCVELVKDFLIYCTKTDITEDFPNIIKVIGDVIGYLISFGTLTLADYKKLLLLKYVEDVSSKVFVQIVQAICRLRGPAMLYSAIPSEASLREFVSPFLYRKYSSAKDFEPVDFRAKCLDRYGLSFLLDQNPTVDHPHRVSTSDNLELVNTCLHYFVAHSDKVSAARDYVSVNFTSSNTTLMADVYFALTQKICYESLEPSDATTYRLNDSKFRTLYASLVAASLSSLDDVLPSLYSILDVNLHLQLPAGLLLSQFVIAKETLVDCSLAGGNLTKVNTPFKKFAEDKSLYHVPSSGLARVLSKELVIQDSGFSKTSALPSLKNFYNSIEEEEESEDEGEEGEK